MKICKIEVFKVNVPWRRKYVAFYTTVSEIEHAFVKIYTDDGVMGFGEVTSFLFFTGENTGTIVEVIKQLEPVIKGLNPFDLEKIAILIDKTVRFNNTAKAAIDFALHDIIGKKIGLNTIYFLGGKCIDKIPLSWSLSIGDPDEVAVEASEMLEKGFGTFNLKIGLNIDEDVERVRKVRKTIGDKPNIRVDANGAFTPMQAIQIIKRMEEYNLQYVEQPVPGWNIDGMAEVRKHVNVQISADESVFYLHDALDVIKKGAADILSLKVAKMGGIRRTMQIAAVAEAANMPCLMNSSFELDIGVSAAAIVAASSGMVQYSSEITGPMRHHTDIIKKGMEYENGFIIPSMEPGLGIEIDEKKLERYRIF
jgi:L-alanine-DL-glutamate epimerase-like enolase superfamily enzyme